MPQQMRAEFGTLLHLLEEQQLRKLPHNRALGAEYVAHDLDALISAHQMEEHPERLEEGEE